MAQCQMTTEIEAAAEEQDRDIKKRVCSSVVLEVT